MFGSYTSTKRKRVNTLRLMHSLALRACILKGVREHGDVQLSYRNSVHRLPENLPFGAGRAYVHGRRRVVGQECPTYVFRLGDSASASGSG